MEILFVTDFVCPYCIVGKEAMNQALSESGVQADIKIQPFELTQEPKERVDTFHDEARREHYKELLKPAQELGLNVTIPPAVVPRPYTRLAFEGWHYAEKMGVGTQYADKVYEAYFTLQKDIGQVAVLAELAVNVGLDSEEFKRVLAEGIYSQVQKEAVAYAREVLKIRHVPTVYVDGEEIDFQAYQKESWLAFLRGRQKSAKEQGTENFSCSVDGCG